MPDTERPTEPLEEMILYHGSLDELNRRLAPSAQMEFAPEPLCLSLFNVNSMEHLEEYLRSEGYGGLVNYSMVEVAATHVINSWGSPRITYCVNGTPVVKRSASDSSASA